MFHKILRLITTFLGGLIGYGVTSGVILILKYPSINIQVSTTIELIIEIAGPILFAIIFFLLYPFIQRRGAKVTKFIETDLQKVPAHELMIGTIGLIFGLIIAFLISQIYAGITVGYIGTILSIITYIITGYLGVVISTRRGKDLFTSWAQFMRNIGTPNKPKLKGDSTPKILDTSVIIDGRIADIMKTGFIEGTIVIPEFVLTELQHIADSSDGLKRNRGRRGLDILNRIQEDYGIEIYNTGAEKSLEEIPEVDIKLLKLAQIIHGKVVTNDYNLNKVAGIKGVDVLNINDLANALKPVVLPGEDMTLFLVKEGKENNQGIAYLDDGTMIVVEDGRKYIGETIKTTVTSVLQTSAGRMIFAKPKR